MSRENTPALISRIEAVNCRFTLFLYKKINNNKYIVLLGCAVQVISCYTLITDAFACVHWKHAEMNIFNEDKYARSRSKNENV